jgi:hypothetical protein
MRGSIQKTSRVCKEHGRIAAERNSLPMGCGDLIMVLLTVGLWIPARLILARVSNPWRCPQCGRRV